MKVIVASTGSYSDAWVPFWGLFQKFWTDCPWPVMLVTDHAPRPIPFPNHRVIGHDGGWCKNLASVLRAPELVPEEFVLLLQEDFWLNFPTNTAFIQKALATLKSDATMGAFRIYPCPLPDRPITDEYGLLAPYAPYRVSCQATIWRKSELLFLLEHFNTPREFENDGSRLSSDQRSHMKYVAVSEADPNKWPIQYYCSAITRGEYDPGALAFCAKHGIPTEPGARPIMRCPS